MRRRAEIHLTRGERLQLLFIAIFMLAAVLSGIALGVLFHHD